MGAALKLLLPPDASELIVDEGDEDEVNTGDIIVNIVPECLYIRTDDYLSSLNHSHVLVFRQKKNRKNNNMSSVILGKNKSPHYTKLEAQAESLASGSSK
ncbi:hypothetical protein TNCT_74441 [Trichonephila clavata]|uniref:Uncharacterized protein n=1 Tax=Trichonephila clavata TaxID=2740835 RepID=A0A8X6H148_TRICU|nr:hypothetical protein TNCT_74441 [Trichonephila clavata]